MVNNSKAFQLAKYAVMTATIFVAMLLDRVISLGLPISTAACVLLVTFSFCYLENRWSNGVLVCALFGLVSFIKEFIFPSSVAAFPIYVWPLITILPRAVMGVVAFGVYRLMLFVLRPLKRAYAKQIIAITTATLLGNITNTVLFLLALNTSKIVAGMDYTSLLIVIKGVILTNILPEYLISMILAPYVVLGVRKGLRIGIDGNNCKRAQKEEKQSAQLREEDVATSHVDLDANVVAPQDAVTNDETNLNTAD